MIAKRFACLLLFSAVAGMAFCQSPVEILKRSMEARQRVVANLIQTQSMPGESSMVTTFKISYDGQGRVRRSILQPIRVQGMVSVDDGKNWTMLDPDKKVVSMQPSPVTLSIKDRVELISRNYDLRIIRAKRVADRSTTALLCTPKSPGAPIRKLYFDRVTSLLLRCDISTESGGEKNILDTQWMEVPTYIDPELFSLPVPDGFHVVRCSGSKITTSSSEAKRMAGFSPVMPRSLPNGFSVERIEVVSGAPKGMVALRLSDGFVTVTAYQWDPSTKPHTIGVRGTQKMVRDERVHMLVVGELPQTVLQGIVDYLKKEFFNQALGLGTLDPAGLF